jgi:hypothetical protein
LIDLVALGLPDLSFGIVEGLAQEEPVGRLGCRIVSADGNAAG